MRRPSYAAVTGVTVAMAVLGFVRVTFVDLIPPPNPEIAGWGEGEFVQRAEAQSIEWRPLNKEAFDEARRLSRPLLVVVGLPWSALGRQADQTFASPDVARALSRNFVPVRVDAAQDPRWVAQFLPLQRAQTGFSVGFQAWVFDLKGRLIAFIGRFGSGDTMDEATVLRALGIARDEFGKAALSDDPPELQIDQNADIDRLTNPGVVNLSLANSATQLLAEIDPVWGGWNMRGLVGPRPLAIRFLQLAGEWDGVGRSLRRAALSSRCDWLDGGFYRVVRRDNGVPEYDKPSVPNAQFAEALAVQDAARPDPILRRVARQTIDWLMEMRDGILLPGAEMGDENPQGRSARASFSPLRLREAVRNGTIALADAEWAEANLGIDGHLGPARTIVPRAEAVGDPRFDRILDALRHAAGPPRERVAPRLCDVNGTVAACVLRCARLWNDRELAGKAGEIVDRLAAQFQSPTGTMHSSESDGTNRFLLADALAFSDACLQDFLTNGRVPSLERGVAALRRALTRFGDSSQSFLRSSVGHESLFPGLEPLPQVTDDECEASSAVALRLLGGYAAVLGAKGQDLDAWSNRLNDRLGAVTTAAPAQGGALGALAAHLDARAAFTVGPDALGMAARLASRFPNRLIVPVVGGVRSDLSGRPAGIYVSNSTGLTGPFSEAELAKRLPKELEIGL